MAKQYLIAPQFSIDAPIENYHLGKTTWGHIPVSNAPKRALSKMRIKVKRDGRIIKKIGLTRKAGKQLAKSFT